VRVLFVSDVYFPRVNGVSTSVWTFRQDLAACDVETVLVAPDYASAGGAAESGVVRIGARGVPGDPEDRRMRWGGLTRALEDLAGFDLVHIHTPFLAHYAGVRYARRQPIHAAPRLMAIQPSRRQRRSLSRTSAQAAAATRHK
jgi:1,2-diacylglycerol 3-alpha-glucosyltransferase